MTPEDREFVQGARRKWTNIVDNSEDMVAGTAALAVGLWATLHVDRLFRILDEEADRT